MSESTPLLKPKSSKDDGVPSLCSQRWILAYVSWFGFLMVYAARVNLSVGIVCMVNDTDANTTSAASEHGEFFWSKGDQSGILSAYFYGYIVTQIPAGWLAGRYGAKHMIFIGMLIGSWASLFLPIGARASIYLVYMLRVLQGVSQGILFPSMLSLFGRWVPPLERTKLFSFSYSGAPVGSIAAFSISGILCQYGFDNGWGSIFYITGGISVLWCGVWYIFVYNTPAEHPRITQQERDYIIHSIGEKQKKYSTPWLALLTSQATWVYVICDVCVNWVKLTLLIDIPTFMKEVLHFDIAQSGLLSSIPYASQAISGMLNGYIADYLRSQKYLSTTVTRRLFQSIAFLGAGSCLIGTGFIDEENRYYAIVLLTASMWFTGMGNAGYVVNSVDFAPRYAGVLSGISNATGAVSGIVAPLLAGALTPRKSQEEWRNVFYVCAGFCVLGTLVFGTRAQGEVQPWAMEKIEVTVVVEDKPQTGAILSVKDRGLDKRKCAEVSSEV